MKKSKIPKFTIRLASADRASIILEFHHTHVGDYLWPRTLEEFKSMIQDECLYELVKPNRRGVELIGICYIAQGTDQESKLSRKEFGGIFLLEKYRGGKKFGLARILGMAAICEHFIWDNSDERMIAHVHQENNLPRRLLVEDLGFKPVGQEIPPPHLVPKNMKKNEEGNVVGDLFEFQREKLKDFAIWLSEFKGWVNAEVKFRVDLELTIGVKRRDAAKALRTFSGPNLPNSERKK